MAAWAPVMRSLTVFLLSVAAILALMVCVVAFIGAFLLGQFGF